jgi:hypothetical protein
MFSLCFLVENVDGKQADKTWITMHNVKCL